MGRPRTWVLLRGLARQAEHWGDFLTLCKEKFPNDRFLTPDLPGMGEVKAEKIPADIKGFVESVRSQVFRESDGPFHLFAISLGGMVSLSWLEHYPKEIDKAFIVNSSSSLSPFYRRLRWEVWGEFLKIITTPDARAGETKVLELISNHVEKREKVLPLWVSIRNLNRVNPKTPVLQLRAASRFRVPQSSSDFDKAHFLVSLGDRMVEPSCTIELAEHFSRPILKHSWGGHDLPIDDPDWILGKLSQILD